MPEEKEKRNLQLVVNNDPGYRIKRVELSALLRIQRKHQKQIDTIEETNSWYVESMKKSFHKKAAIVASAVAAVACIYISQYNPQNAPRGLFPLKEDLNQDQVIDAYILQKNGHKVPMYGLRINGNTIAYVSAGYLKNTRDDIIDYESIEDKLNEEQIVLNPVNY